MDAKLGHLLRSNFDAITQKWSTSLKNMLLSYKTRPVEELKLNTAEHLRAVIDIVEFGNHERLDAFVSKIAALRSSLNFNLSETQKAFLIGERVIDTFLEEELADNLEELNRSVLTIDNAFHEAIWRYSEVYQGIQIERTQRRAEAEAETAKRKLEEEIEKQERYIATVMNDSADAIIILDEKDIIRSWNRGAELIFGYSKEEIIGQPFELLVPERLKQAREFERISAELKERGFIRNYETEGLTKNGKKIIVDLTRTIITNKENRVLGSSAVIKETTEKKEMERQLIQSERLVTIGKMSTHIAHEIKNPLSSISLNIELLEDEIASFHQENTTEAKTLLMSISSAMDRLIQILQEYLQFSRIPKLKFKKKSVNEVVEDLLQLLGKEIQSANIVLVKNLDPYIPDILMDEDHMYRALLNILRNSLEAMPSEGRLSVLTSYQDDAVEISVSDTGVGIEDEDIEKIFDPFYSTKKNGTGLGLPMTKEIIQLHNGRIECFSSPGQGTTFKVVFPVPK